MDRVNKILAATGIDVRTASHLDQLKAAKWEGEHGDIHDHRSVVNDVNIHVAGNSPVERTERPLSRPRNADLIRNTASYAA